MFIYSCTPFCYGDYKTLTPSTMHGCHVAFHIFSPFRWTKSDTRSPSITPICLCVSIHVCLFRLARKHRISAVFTVKEWIEIRDFKSQMNCEASFLKYFFLLPSEAKRHGTNKPSASAKIGFEMQPGLPFLSTAPPLTS
jgi:hypothetical protein